MKNLLSACCYAVIVATAGRAPGQETAQKLPGPIPEEWSAALKAVVPDPPPKELCLNAHFVVSDERAHYLFRDAVKDRGGMFIGVGTDQNYLMAAWAKADFLVLMDFDQVIADVHKVYRALFLNAGDPKRFFDLWTEAKAGEARRAIEKEYTDKAERSVVLNTYKTARNMVEWRLIGLKKTYGAKKVSTFLDDREQYDYVVNLFRTGRVLIVRGDLTGTRTMAGIARAAKTMKMPVGVFYPSNAEGYFSYTKAFRENMLALPFDSRTVVIRTSGRGEKGSGDGHYHYLVQDGLKFLEWVKDPRTVRYYPLLHVSKRDPKIEGLYRIEALPPPVKGKPVKAGEKKK